MAATGKRATSLQSMASTSIGPAGAWLSSAAFVFLHMALLIAYCSRGGELLTSLPPGRFVHVYQHGPAGLIKKLFVGKVSSEGFPSSAPSASLDLPSLHASLVASSS